MDQGTLFFNSSIASCKNKEYLTAVYKHWLKSCKEFLSEHYAENRLTLWCTVAKLWCHKLCAVFWTTLYLIQNKWRRSAASKLLLFIHVDMCVCSFTHGGRKIASDLTRFPSAERKITPNIINQRWKGVRHFRVWKQFTVWRRALLWHTPNTSEFWSGYCLDVGL